MSLLPKGGAGRSNELGTRVNKHGHELTTAFLYSGLNCAAGHSVLKSSSVPDFYQFYLVTCGFVMVLDYYFEVYSSPLVCSSQLY